MRRDEANKQQRIGATTSVNRCTRLASSILSTRETDLLQQLDEGRRRPNMAPTPPTVRGDLQCGA